MSPRAIRLLSATYRTYCRLDGWDAVWHIVGFGSLGATRVWR